MNISRSQDSKNKDVLICALPGSYASRGPRKCWFQVSVCRVDALRSFFGLLGSVEVIRLSQRFVCLCPRAALTSGGMIRTESPKDHQ